MNRIKELRIAAGLSQAQLAKKLGFNQTGVGKYERGEIEPSISTLKKLSVIFECSIDYLVGFSDDFGNVQVHPQTDAVDALSPSEQRVIECLRKISPYNGNDWMILYAELPRYLQEALFAELKGAHLAFKAKK